MAEIKSTIDLIMERTKNLTITGEEKMAIREKEFTAKARGLLSRHLDGNIGADSVIEEIGRDIEETPYGRRIIRRVLPDYLDPDAEYGKTLKLIKKFLGVDPSPVEKILASFPKAVSSLEASRSVKIMEELNNEGISGSAVTPNCAGDQTWHDEVKKVKDKFKKDIEAALA
jgi:hypothetical protein